MAYTHEDILSKLQRIRDNSLDWMLECTENREGKGSGAAQSMYERAVEDINKLESRLGSKEDTEIETVYDSIDEDAAKQWKQLYPDMYDSLDVRDES